MAEKAGEADGIEAARMRFEQWRSSRSGKTPIPDELWKLAINAPPGRHSVYPHADRAAP